MKNARTPEANYELLLHQVTGHTLLSTQEASRLERRVNTVHEAGKITTSQREKLFAILWADVDADCLICNALDL